MGISPTSSNMNLLNIHLYTEIPHNAIYKLRNRNSENKISIKIK